MSWGVVGEGILGKRGVCGCTCMNVCGVFSPLARPSRGWRVWLVAYSRVVLISIISIIKIILCFATSWQFSTKNSFKNR